MDGDTLLCIVMASIVSTLVSFFWHTQAYEVDLAEVKEEQCNIDKPSGTVCEYVGTWVAKSVEDKENK